MWPFLTKQSLLEKQTHEMHYTQFQLVYVFCFFLKPTSVYSLTVMTLSCLFLSDVDAPFARWSKDQVCDWLQEQGLGLYVNMARVWISSGQTLLQASQQDLERVRWRENFISLAKPADGKSSFTVECTKLSIWDVVCSPYKCACGCVGTGHQTPAAQKEAAAGSAGSRLRGGG